jgi:Na+-driven multidrug efflux pump
VSWAVTGVAAAVVNPGLNLVLIPYFDAAFGNGGIGAASATVLTELFMTMAALWLLRGTTFDRADLAFGLRCLAGALLMCGAVWLVLDLFLPLTIAIGGLVYFAAAWMLGTVTVQDIQHVRAYAVRHTRRPEPAV